MPQAHQSHENHCHDDAISYRSIAVQPKRLASSQHRWCFITLYAKAMTGDVTEMRRPSNHITPPNNLLSSTSARSCFSTQRSFLMWGTLAARTNQPSFALAWLEMPPSWHWGMFMTCHSWNIAVPERSEAIITSFPRTSDATGQPMLAASPLPVASTWKSYREGAEATQLGSSKINS